MSELLNNNPLFILFLVIALGYGMGSLKIKGNKLGVAAVLFCGLIMGKIFPAAHIPETIVWLGLIIFIYAIGLNSGSNFFNTFKSKGAKIISFIICSLVIVACLTLLAAVIFEIDKSTLAGLFAGATTNTSSLAALLDLISQSNMADKENLINKAVTGYSICYPIGIFGVIIAMQLVERILKVDFKAEEHLLREEYDLESKMVRKKVKVLHRNAVGKSIRTFKKENNLRVVFGRYMRNEKVYLTHFDTTIQEGDIFFVVGNELNIERCIKILGEATEALLNDTDTVFVNRRVFVSNPKIVGQSLASLNLTEKFPIVVSRFRRGDIDLLASNDTILELGDRIRFVAKRDQIKEIQEFFGDSYDSVSKINLATFGIGIFLGLWLGTIPLPIPGDINLKLGFAGGPLLVALILGALHKTGPILWTIPYSTNMTLRQIGLVIMLAGIGINSGNSFFDTIVSSEGLKIFGIGVGVVIISTVFSLVLGYKIFKIPFSLLLGLMANQPAILDYGEERTKNKLPNIGFSIMLPLAIIAKIFITQLIFMFYSG